MATLLRTVCEGAGVENVMHIDQFWARVQMDLLELPRPSEVLPKLEPIDPYLYGQLIDGEQALMRETDAAGSEVGWAWWLTKYKRAVKMVSATGPQNPDLR